MQLHRMALLFALAAPALPACTELPPASPTEPQVVIGPLLLPANPYRLSHTPAPEHLLGGKQVADGIALADGDPFELDGLRRLSAETGTTFPMAFTGDSAFFRDVAVSAFHTLRASADGQTWRLDVLHPNGAREVGGTITFRRNFNGETDCFVAGLSSLCGGEIVFLFIDLSVQCANTGLYRFIALFNGAEHATGNADFRLVPRIPPGASTLQLQTDFNTTPYDSSCVNAEGNSYKCTGAPGETPRTIRSKGCALTSAAMMLEAFGVHTDPEALNTWMNEHGGYAPVGQFNFPVLSRFAADSGRNIRVAKVNVNSTDSLRTWICRFGPQVIEVRNATGGQHFVLATGLTDAGVPTILDPASAARTDLSAYNNSFRSIRKSERRTLQVDTLMTGMIVRYYSPGHITLTDPLGRSTGFDPARGTFLSGMPTASYDTLAALSTVNADGSFGPDETDQPKVLEVGDTPAGEYVVDVNGTGTGTYMLSITLFGARGRTGEARFPDVPITNGENHRYAFRYDPAAVGQPGFSIPMSGAFSGGGQSAGADEMLTYSRPGQRQTTLAAGTTQYSMMVFYAPGLKPSTFSAELNGVDVTAMFTAVPGGSQTVTIPLAPGRNVLKLAARGTTPAGKSVSDADNLIFKVP